MFILLLLDAPAFSVAGSERQQQQLLEREPHVSPIGCVSFLCCWRRAPYWMRQIQEKSFYYQIFPNSNSAGANYNSATTVACAVYSAHVRVQYVCILHNI